MTHNEAVERDNPELLTKAEHVTVTFINQKNEKKMDSRTQHQRCTKDPHLCPVIRFGTQILQILSTMPQVNRLTTINTITLKGKAGLIANTHILEILRTSCSSFGANATFGFDSHKIGNRSIHSGAGATMALFNNISAANIMILGRWSSDTFLACI
jgi:hypothetical protein